MPNLGGVLACIIGYLLLLAALRRWLSLFEDTHPIGVLVAYAPRLLSLLPLIWWALQALLSLRLIPLAASLLGGARVCLELLAYQVRPGPAGAGEIVARADAGGVPSDRAGAPLPGELANQPEASPEAGAAEPAPLADRQQAAEAPRQAAPPVLRVASYNAYGGNRDARGVAETAAALDADVIMVQEAWWALPDDGGAAPGATAEHDVSGHMTSLLEGYHTARSAARHELFVASRYPLLEVEDWPLDDTRHCLTCLVDVDGYLVRLVNLHIEPPFMPDRLGAGKPGLLAQLIERSQVRRRQARGLRRLLASISGPCIVAGDFNSPPDSVVCRSVPTSYRDTFAVRGHGFGYTFPEPLPLWRLDYLLVQGPLRVLSHRTVPSKASDHLPIVSELALDF